MTKEEIVDQICNDLSGAGWNLFQGEAEKKQVAEHLARLRYRREDTIVLRCNEDGKWEQYEPYATIECPDKEDYDFIVRAVEHYKQSREGGDCKKEGQWLESKIPDEKYVCSVCGGACWYYDYQRELGKSRYCPSCGAKMERGEKE